MARPWKQPKPLVEILKKALDKWNLTPGLKRHAIFENWSELAGPLIAARSRPLKILGDQLVCEVDHPTWVTELNFLKPQILKKIHQLYPDSRIKNLRFVLK